MVTKQKKFISASKTAFFCNIFVTKVGYIGYNVDYQIVRTNKHKLCQVNR